MKGKGAHKTKEQLMNELAELRQRISGLKKSEKERKKAEEALRESEERYRLLAENVEDVIWTMDLDFRTTYISPSVIRMRGYTPEEVMAQSMKEMLTPASIEVASRTIAEELSAENVEHKGLYRSRTMQLEVNCKDGSTVWTEVKVRFLRDAGGRPIGMEGVLREITEWRQAQQALRESEEKYRSLVTNIPGIVWSGTSKGDIIFISPNVEIVFGHTPEEMYQGTYRLWLESIHPDDVENVREKFRISMVKGVPFDVEYRLQVKDGKWVWLRARATAIYQKDGLTYADGVTSDITSHKQAEEALRQSEEKYRSLVTNIPDIVWTGSSKGDIIFISPNVEMVFGHTPEEMYQGTYRLWLESVHPDDVENMREKFRISMVKGVPFDVEYRLQVEDGKWVWLRSRATAIYQKDSLTYADGVTSDITERKQAENQLRTSQEQLRSLSTHLQSVREEERESVAREIHDELGQALTVLKMDLFWLGKRLPKELETLTARTEAMLRVVDTAIESVKRISAQLRPGLLDDLGLPEAIEWQAQEFQERTGIKCQLRIESPDSVVDRELATTFFRIFQESLTNVARHADATTVEVSLKRKADRLVLRVQDNGKGITREQISYPGSFGLMGMRERARYCGGDFSIRGIQDRGTTVTVSIPLHPEGETKC